MLPTFVIDFDSTFVTVESLDELAKISLAYNPDKDKIARKISDLSKAGMEGKIDFSTSLEKRLALFLPTPDDITKIVTFLQEHITPSIARNKAFFQENHDRIYIISGGFQEYIVPVVKEFGITQNHVLANTFIYNKRGSITGYDKTSLLAKKKGKIHAVMQLGLKDTVIVIGDGYTDYELKEAGIAKKFYAFIENINRPTVASKAEEVLFSFDELLYIYNIPRAFSYPKSRINSLLLENINPRAAELFEQEGYSIETVPGSLSEKELLEKIRDVTIVNIGSRTHMTKKVIDEAKKLLVIGRYGIGTNNIDTRYAAEKGIVVFNAPYSNTRSVVELIIGEIIMLYRRSFEKSMEMHKGVWNKSAKDCHEVRGKKLGIVGYGNIGSQLSVLAEMLGMEVYFYDIQEKLALGKAQACDSLEELLKIADVISINVDGRKENNNLIGEKEFALMKDGIIFINASRGFVVDATALKKNLLNRKVLGAGLDVFPVEPRTNDEGFVSEFRGMRNVILTPHIAGRSIEAQEDMANFVPQKIINYINSGNTILSVNFPNLQLPKQNNQHRLIHVHKNVPGVLAKINGILADHRINIEGQYLKTNEDIGYVITDIAKVYADSVIKALKIMPETIRLRVLY